MCKTPLHITIVLKEMNTIRYLIISNEIIVTTYPLELFFSYIHLHEVN